jgi:hypothetical protein
MYVDSLGIDIYRTALAQFRTGVSQINTHKHRFSLTAENASCPMCGNGAETEIHFLYVCPFYSILRERFLPELSACDNLESHLVRLLKDKSIDRLTNVAKYLFLAFKERSKRENTLN